MLALVLPIQLWLPVTNIFLLFLIEQINQWLFPHIGSNERSSISGFNPSRVPRNLFFFASSANLFCTLHFPSEEGDRVLACPRKRLSRAVYACFLAAQIRTLFRFVGHLQSALASFFQKCNSRSGILSWTSLVYLRCEIQRAICNWTWIMENEIMKIRGL